MKLEKIVDIKILMDRGVSLVNSLKNAVLIGASLKVLLDLSIFFSIILSIFVILAFYLIGLIDTRKFKFMQTESRLLSTRYNPQLNKIK